MFNNNIQIQKTNWAMRLAPYAGVLAFIWVLRGWIINGNLKELLLVCVGLAVLAMAGIVFSDWRKGVYVFFTWLLFEDLVRKYMGNNMAIYFGKDVLIGVTYISFLVAQSRSKVAKHFHPPFAYSLGLFVLLGLAQVFNPNSPSMAYGVLGLKLYFYYAPLMLLGYSLLRTEGDLHRFLVINVSLAGIIALLGIIQSILGLDFLNPKTLAPDIALLGRLTRYAPVSGVAVPRPSSVFVSDGRFAIYLIFVFIMGFGAAGYLLLRTRRGRKFVFPALALIGVAAMMSGSRACFVYVASSMVVLAIGMLWGARKEGGESYRLFKAIRRAATVLALSLLFTAIIFPQEIGARWAFYQETLSPDSPDYEVSNRIWDYPVGNFLAAFDDPEWVMGHGIGTASLGGQYVTRILGVPATKIGVECGYGILVLEFGILGLVLWLVWASIFAFQAGKVVLRLKGTWAFPIGLAIFWFSFLLLFPWTYGGIQPYQNFVLNAYFWVLVGVLFRLPELVDQTLPESGEMRSVRIGLDFGRSRKLLTQPASNRTI